MKRALLILAACGAPAPQLAAHLPADGTVRDRDATPFVVADRYRGQVVVIDFWASWCAECKRSVPQVERLAKGFAESGLVVVGVDEGETGDVAGAAASALGITYPIALDPDFAFSDQMGAQNLPTLLVVDRDGTVVRRTRHLDAETLAVIRGLLGKR